MVMSAAVFCGSRLGFGSAFADLAAELGVGLARRGVTLIYGGAKSGLMGVIADAVLQEGGEVVGVIPKFLHRREVMHEGVTELIVTKTMHTRKQDMLDRADVFIILPGGLGTYDEMFEVLTWRILRLHDKPIIILNHEGWADHLLASLYHAITQGFADPNIHIFYEVVPDVDKVLTRLDTI